jgi:hypothetical protein
MHTDLSKWAETCSLEIQNKLIDALVNEAVDQKILFEDAHIQAWANTNIAFIRACICDYITKMVTTNDITLNAWTTEAADIAFSKAAATATTQTEATATAHYEREMARLMAEATSRIAQDLAIQKSQAEAKADADLAKFKHGLKIETECRKDNATKTADAAVRKVSRNHPNAPVISTSSSR